MPSKVSPTNFEMFSGNTKPVVVDVFDQDENSVNLTGGSASLVLSKTKNSAALVTKAGVLAGSPNLNRVTFTLDPADTEALQGTYYYEVENTDVGGRISTVAFGSITIRSNVA